MYVRHAFVVVYAIRNERERERDVAKECVEWCTEIYMHVCCSVCQWQR